MATLVKKFGGSSVATPKKMHEIVDRILAEKKDDDKIVIVVSAMGDSTDELVSLAKMVNPNMPKREYDRLLATGEQISIALLASAFMSKGQKSLSLTGEQAGIKTDCSYTKASILDVDAKRVKASLDEGYIVIVAGFQGGYDGDITTLGRGGSDTTAVAIAAALKADLCEIYTDVDGVYTADPRFVKDAIKMDEISFFEMLELARLGAGVMQPRAVEYGERNGVVIHVRSTFNNVPGTLIKEACTMQEKRSVIRGIAHDTHVAKIAIKGVKDEPGIASKVFSALADANVVVDMIVQSIKSEDGTNDIVFTVNEEDLVEATSVIERLKGNAIGEFTTDVEINIAKVSIVGAGMLGNPGIAAGMFGALAEAGVNISVISTSEISIMCLVPEDKVELAINTIHNKFFKNECCEK